MADDRDLEKLLQDWREGDPTALSELLSRIYDDVRGIAGRLFAGERRGHTLQATALVHELYLRLEGKTVPRNIESPAHLLGFFATVMSRILIEHARAHKAKKRGGEAIKLSLDDGVTVIQLPPPTEVLAVHEALVELARREPRQAQILRLSSYFGFNLREIAEILETPSSTVHRELAKGKRFLELRLSPVASAEGATA